MKIDSAIVTGGAGFIGSHLIDKLLEQNVDKILIIDDLSTGKKQNVDKYKNNKSVEFIESRVEDVKKLEEKIQNFDICFH